LAKACLKKSDDLAWLEKFKNFFYAMKHADGSVKKRAKKKIPAADPKIQD